MTVIIRLEDAAHSDLGLVGGKARGLGELIAHGFRVPDGFVITPDASADELPELLSAHINAAAGPLAYRSSAVAEDLADASYAGQYETVLGVEGLEAGVAAVARVRSSAATGAASRYRELHHDTDDRIAVIVQRQLDPVASGVAFTRNPVTGTDEVLIEATAGLGDALMSGEVVPERWVVTSTPDCASSPEEPVLTSDQAAEVAALARQAAAALGGPRDVEWAYDPTGLWLLQARPITALPIEPTARPPKDQRWERADAFFPGPVTQLGFSAWLPTHTRVTGEALGLFGVPSDGIDHALYWGRVYDRLIPPGGAKKDTGGLPPLPILRLLMRIVPAFRRAVRNAVEAERTDLPMQLIETWENGGRDSLRSRTQELRSVELGVLTDAALVSHIEDLEAHVTRAGLEHFRLSFGGFVVLGQLGMLMEELLGWEPARVLDLVAGYGGASRTEGHALAATAKAVAADPVASQALDEPTRLVTLPGPGADAVRAFLAEHGHRSLDLRMTAPTWAEDPTPIIGLLRHATDVDTDDTALRAKAAEAETEAIALIADPVDCRRFQDAVIRARTARPYGDETERDPLDGSGLFRYAAVEAGTRLHASGALAHADDVEFLTVDELKAALGGSPPNPDTIGRRKAELRWALANPSPRVVGPKAGPPPPPSMFPPKAQPIAGAFMWALGNLFDAPVVEHDGEGALRGLGASAGTVRGIARVIKTPAEFHRIRHGDIVVCPSTMASWSPVFPVIAGLVTEVGGPLSHPGTLAREYGLPAVLGVSEATTLIADGAEVRIDGAAGTVEILSG